MNEQPVIEEQLREWLGTVEQQGGLSKVGLVHCTSGGPRSEITMLSDGNPTWKDAGKMADVIDRVARRHASGLSGAQSFQLEACFGASPHPTRFLPFMRMGMLSYGYGSTVGTDPPTPMGQLSQAMRLTEQQAQLGVRMTEHASDKQDQLITRLMKRLEDSEFDQRETKIAFLELHRKFIEFQTTKNMEMLAFLRASGERLQFMRMTPAILNAITDHEVFPMSSTDSALLRALVAEGDQKEIDAHILKLTERKPETAAAIAHRVKELRTEIEEERAELKRMARNTESVSLEDALAEVTGETRKVSLLTGGATNGHANGAAAGTPKGPVSKLPSADIDMAWDMPKERAGLREKIEDFVTQTAKELAADAQWDGDRAHMEVDKGMAKGTRIEVLVGEQLRVRLKLEGLARASRGAIEQRLREAGQALFK